MTRNHHHGDSDWPGHRSDTEPQAGPAGGRRDGTVTVSHRARSPSLRPQAEGRVSPGDTVTLSDSESDSESHSRPG
jgi:hypothetical protein